MLITNVAYRNRSPGCIAQKVLFPQTDNPVEIFLEQMVTEGDEFLLFDTQTWYLVREESPVPVTEDSLPRETMFILERLKEPAEVQ